MNDQLSPVLIYKEPILLPVGIYLFKVKIKTLENGVKYVQN